MSPACTPGPADPLVTLVLAHGAGAGMDHPFMAGFARAMNDLGVATLRFNFPYIESRPARAGSRAVPRGGVARGVRRGERTREGRTGMGGRESLGGRIASMAVADDGMAAAGLVFLGYPLHPPGKPERIRDEHLYRIDVPMIFVEGTRDPFATPELLAGVIAKLGDRAELISIEGGDHSMNVKGAKRDAREVAAGLAEPVSAAIRERMR